MSSGFWVIERHLDEDRRKIICFQPSEADARRLCAALEKEFREWWDWLRISALEVTDPHPSTLLSESVIDVDKSERGRRRRARMIDGLLPCSRYVTYNTWEIGEQPERYVLPDAGEE